VGAELQLMKRTWVHDLVAGVTVAIVALPLALGFGITSGAGPASGLATAIIAGLIAALLGGSRFQVSGPTGAMTVILVPIIAAYGISALFAVCLLAGIMLIGLGLLQTGRWMERIPWSVAEGFTLGIALVIALQQIPLIFEVPKASGSETLSVALETIASVFANPVHWWSVGVVLVTLAIKIAWSRFGRGVSRRFVIPASAVAVLTVTLLVQVAHVPVTTLGRIPSSSIFQVSVEWPNMGAGPLIYFACMIALLAGVEALLAARVADSMYTTRHPDATPKPHHNPNRELVGQGLATIASGLVGGMPSTGAIARTGVNVHAGAQTRLAAIFHALALAIFVFVLAPVVALIPTAVLAGVLLGTSWRIANPQSVIENMRTTTVNRFAYLITAVGVLTIDLIWGTVIGVLVYVIGNWLQRRRDSRSMAN